MTKLNSCMDWCFAKLVPRSELQVIKRFVKGKTFIKFSQRAKKHKFSPTSKMAWLLSLKYFTLQFPNDLSSLCASSPLGSILSLPLEWKGLLEQISVHKRKRKFLASYIQRLAWSLVKVCTCYYAMVTYHILFISNLWLKSISQDRIIFKNKGMHNK